MTTVEHNWEEVHAVWSPVHMSRQARDTLMSLLKNRLCEMESRLGKCDQHEGAYRLAHRIAEVNDLLGQLA